MVPTSILRDVVDRFAEDVCAITRPVNDRTSLDTAICALNIGTGPVIEERLADAWARLSTIFPKQPPPLFEDLFRDQQQEMANYVSYLRTLTHLSEEEAADLDSAEKAAATDHDDRYRQFREVQNTELRDVLLAIVDQNIKWLREAEADEDSLQQAIRSAAFSAGREALRALHGKPPPTSSPIIKPHDFRSKIRRSPPTPEEDPSAKLSRTEVENHPVDDGVTGGDDYGYDEDFAHHMEDPAPPIDLITPESENGPHQQRQSANSRDSDDFSPEIRAGIQSVFGTSSSSSSQHNSSGTTDTPGSHSLRLIATTGTPFLPTGLSSPDPQARGATPSRPHASALLTTNDQNRPRDGSKPPPRKLPRSATPSSNSRAGPTPQNPDLGTTSLPDIRPSATGGGGSRGANPTPAPTGAGGGGPPDPTPPRVQPPGTHPTAVVQMMASSNRNNGQKNDPIPTVLDPQTQQTSREMDRTRVPDHGQRLCRPLDGSRMLTKLILRKGGALFTTRNLPAEFNAKAHLPNPDCGISVIQYLESECGSPPRFKPRGATAEMWLMELRSWLRDYQAQNIAITYGFDNATRDHVITEAAQKDFIKNRSIPPYWIFRDDPRTIRMLEVLLNARGESFKTIRGEPRRFSPLFSLPILKTSTEENKEWSVKIGILRDAIQGEQLWFYLFFTDAGAYPQGPEQNQDFLNYTATWDAFQTKAISDLQRHKRGNAQQSTSTYVTSTAFDDFCKTQEVRTLLAHQWTATKLPPRLMLYRHQPNNPMMDAAGLIECPVPLSGRRQLPEPPENIRRTADEAYNYMDWCFPPPTTDGSPSFYLRDWNGVENRPHNPLCRQGIVVAFLYHKSIQDIAANCKPTIRMWMYHLTGDEELSARAEDTNFINDNIKIASSRQAYQNGPAKDAVISAPSFFLKTGLRSWMYEGPVVEEIDMILREYQAKSQLPFYDNDGLPNYLEDAETCEALIRATAKLSDGTAMLVKRHGDNGHIAANKPFGHDLGLVWDHFTGAEFNATGWRYNTNRWPTGMWEFIRNLPTIKDAFSDASLATMDNLWGGDFLLKIWEQMCRKYQWSVESWTNLIHHFENAPLPRKRKARAARMELVLEMRNQRTRCLGRFFTPEDFYRAVHYAMDRVHDPEMRHAGSVHLQEVVRLPLSKYSKELFGEAAVPYPHDQHIREYRYQMAHRRDLGYLADGPATILDPLDTRYRGTTRIHDCLPAGDDDSSGSDADDDIDDEDDDEDPPPSHQLGGQQQAPAPAPATGPASRPLLSPKPSGRGGPGRGGAKGRRRMADPSWVENWETSPTDHSDNAQGTYWTAPPTHAGQQFPGAHGSAPPLVAGQWSSAAQGAHGSAPPLGAGQWSSAAQGAHGSAPPLFAGQWSPAAQGAHGAAPPLVAGQWSPAAQGTHGATPPLVAGQRYSMGQGAPWSPSPPDTSQLHRVLPDAHWFPGSPDASQKTQWHASSPDPSQRGARFSLESSNAADAFLNQLASVIPDSHLHLGNPSTNPKGNHMDTMGRQLRVGFDQTGAGGRQIQVVTPDDRPQQKKRDSGELSLTDLDDEANPTAVTLADVMKSEGISIKDLRQTTRGRGEDDDTTQAFTVKTALQPRMASALSSRVITQSLEDGTPPQLFTTKFRERMNSLTPAETEHATQWWKAILRYKHRRYGRGLDPLHRNGNDKAARMLSNRAYPTVDMATIRAVGTKDHWNQCNDFHKMQNSSFCTHKTMLDKGEGLPPEATYTWRHAQRESPYLYVDIELRNPVLQRLELQDTVYEYVGAFHIATNETSLRQRLEHLGIKPLGGPALETAFRYLLEEASSLEGSELDQHRIAARTFMSFLRENYSVLYTAVSEQYSIAVRQLYSDDIRELPRWASQGIYQLNAVEQAVDIVCLMCQSNPAGYGAQQGQVSRRDAQQFPAIPAFAAVPAATPIQAPAPSPAPVPAPAPTPQPHQAGHESSYGASQQAGREFGYGRDKPKRMKRSLRPPWPDRVFLREAHPGEPVCAHCFIAGHVATQCRLYDPAFIQAYGDYNISVYDLAMEPLDYQELLLTHAKTYGRLKDATAAYHEITDKRMQDARDELARQAAEREQNPGAQMQGRRNGWGGRGRGGRN